MKRLIILALILCSLPAYAVTMFQIKGQVVNQLGQPVKAVPITATMVDAQGHSADCLLATGERVFPIPVVRKTDAFGNFSASLVGTSQCTVGRYIWLHSDSPYPGIVDLKAPLDKSYASFSEFVASGSAVASGAGVFAIHEQNLTSARHMTPLQEAALDGNSSLSGSNVVASMQDIAAAGGAVPATDVVMGTTRLTVAPSVSGSPIAVGDNDPRMHQHSNEIVLDRFSDPGTGLLYNGSPIEGGGGGAVDSVFGRTGVVTAQAGDYTADKITQSASYRFTSDTQQNTWNAKEPAIVAGTTSQYYRGDKTFQTLDKAAVGLGNVDNTSDVNKPVSSATTTALNLKTDVTRFTNFSSHDHTTPVIDANIAGNTSWWQSVKSTLKTYFDTLYQTIAAAWSATNHPTTVAGYGLTDAKTTTAFTTYSSHRADQFLTKQDLLTSAVNCTGTDKVSGFTNGTPVCTGDQTGAGGTGITTLNGAVQATQTFANGANISVTTDTGTGQHTIAATGLKTNSSFTSYSTARQLDLKNRVAWGVYSTSTTVPNHGTTRPGDGSAYLSYYKGSLTCPSPLADGEICSDNSAAASGTGSVTSVAATVPTGFSVAGSPITSSGSLDITFESGYSLPTSANQTLWTNHLSNTGNPHNTTAAQVSADPTGTASGLMTTHNTTYKHTNIPTDNQVAAFAGTSGTAPSGVNKFVDNLDSRLSNSRAPTAHASSHITGGSDIIPAATSSASGLLPAGVYNAGTITATTFVGALTGTASGNLTSASILDATKLSGTASINTTGTAANLSGTPLLPTGTTANTPTAGDSTAKIATTQFVATAVSNAGGGNVSNSGTPTNHQLGVWTGATNIKGVSVTGSSVMCTDANGEPIACTNVTNDVQTKASVVPNTIPTAGQIHVGNAGGTAFANVSMSGDATLASTGAITVTKTNGVPFGTAAAKGVSGTGSNVATVTGSQTVNKQLTYDASGNVVVSAFDVNGGGTFTGGTLTSKLITKTSDSTSASLNIPLGSAPSTPVTGDLYYGVGGLTFYNGATKTLAYTDSNITGTSVGLSAISALPNGTTATTQTAGDNSTKVATTAYVNSAVSAAGGGNVSNYGTPALHQFGVWQSTTQVKGVAVTASKVVCTDSSGEPVACTNLLDVIVDGGSF